MTDTNAKLAKAMGWKVSYSTNEAGDHLCASPCKLHSVVPNFSTSHDAFHTHVLPELERRDLLEAWAEKVADLATPSPWNRGRYGGLAGITFTGLAACLSAPASVLCEAALAVMGGGE